MGELVEGLGARPFLHALDLYPKALPPISWKSLQHRHQGLSCLGDIEGARAETLISLAETLPRSVGRPVRRMRQRANPPASLPLPHRRLRKD